MKSHYTCQAHVRGASSPGCHKTVQASRGDHGALRRAGWAHNGNHRRDHWKCPVCKPQKVRVG